MRPRSDYHSFGLNLGSTAWRIAAAPELKEWMLQFAKILGLRPWKEDGSAAGGKDRRMMLLLPDLESPGAGFPEAVFLSEEGGRLPREGWTAVSLLHLRLWRHPRVPALILQVKTEETEESRILAMSEACLPLYIRVIETGGLPMHAALLSRDGKAVALAAPGGTGKSTCARRAPRPWVALADDLALITRRNADDADFEAHPFPTWSDYIFKRGEGAWKAEERLPLRAVFFLSRSTEDRLLGMGQGEAAIHLGQSGHQILSVSTRGLPLPEMRRLRTELFDNACRLARSLPVYRLELTLTGAFWREIERVL